MATTTKHEIGFWDTFHNNGPFPTKVLYNTTLETAANMPAVFDRYNDAAKEIQRLLKIALDKNEGFRAYGSKWSLSNIAHHKENMHYNGNMNLKKPIADDELHSGSPYSKENLFLFQCGNVIKEISKYLADHGKSLKASGASNGQTIAGCVSTGVHGSAMDVGAVQDCIVGINLITGPNASDIVYIERNSRPALNDIFASRINARVIRNDELFNAALVSLGAFGFIHGVVLEAEDRYLLKRYVKRLHKDSAMKLAETLDFTGQEFHIPGETDADGKPNRPFHYKVFVNPYVNDHEYVAEVIYKKPFQHGYPDPIPRIKTAIYRDLIVLFTKIAEQNKNNIPKLIKALQTTVLPPVDLEVTGTLAEIFWDAPYQGPAFALAVGIDHRDAPKAMELLGNLAKEEGPIPGIYAMRFVKKSEALLACTRFSITCMLEIDGILWKPKRPRDISLEKFSTRTIEVLQVNNIPFTLHWGKNADWTFPGLIQHMYGNDVRRWKEQRSALLSKEAAALFSNGFLEATKLSEYLANVPAYSEGIVV